MKGKFVFVVMIGVIALFARSSHAAQIEPSPAADSDSMEMPDSPVGTPVCGPVENVVSQY